MAGSLVQAVKQMSIAGGAVTQAGVDDSSFFSASGGCRCRHLNGQLLPSEYPVQTGATIKETLAPILTDFPFAAAAGSGIVVRRSEGGIVKKFFLNGCGYHNDLVFAASGRFYQTAHVDFSRESVFFPLPVLLPSRSRDRDEYSTSPPVSGNPSRDEAHRRFFHVPSPIYTNPISDISEKWRGTNVLL